MALDTLSDAELASLIYPRPNLKDYTLDEQALALSCTHKHVNCPSSPTQDLGDLDRLPLEVLSEILLKLSLADLMTVTQVNRRAIQVVNSIPQWKAVSAHGDAVIRGLISTRFAANHSLLDIHGTMCTSQCAECGDFGGFIYLFTCTRVCFLCFSEMTKYYPLTIAEATRQFGVKTKVLSHLPMLETVPGVYSPNQKACPKQLILVDPELARRAASSFHGSEEAMTEYVAEDTAQREESYRTRMDAWRASRRQSRKPRSAPVVNHAEHDHTIARRFMAVVQAPHMDTAGTTAYWGFHCNGCKRSYRERPMHWRRKFTLETFTEHLRQCGRIRKFEHVKD